MLQKDWFENRKWLTPFAQFGICAVLGILGLLVVIIDKEVMVKEWAIFEAFLIGISAPPIFIETRKIKYDLVKKWTLKKEKQ